MPTTDSRTQQITITLPTDVADAIRAKVASGEYESESEFVHESIALVASLMDSHTDEGWGPSDEWLTKHALPALDALDTDPSSGVRLEDLSAELVRRRNLRQRHAA